MNDLIAFVTARLDEDEQVARAVDDNSSPWPGVWKADGENALRTYNDWVLIWPGLEGRTFAPGLIAHIARHDPARVLREIDSKRLLLDLHKCVLIRPGAEQFNDAHLTSHPMKICCSCEPEKMWRRERSWPCRTLRTLALPYADHADYQADWKP